MALTIYNNSLTYKLLSNISRLQIEHNQTLTRLSTGKRINSAADDPSGLVAAMGLKSDLVAVEAALSNNQRSQAVLDVADATLGEVLKIAEEIERLAIDAQDPNATSAEIAANQSALDSHLATLDSLVNNAEFAGTRIFTGTNAITGTSANAAYTDVRVHQADGDATANKVFSVVYNAAADTVTVDGTLVGSASTNGDQVSFTKDGYNLSFTLANTAANVTANVTVTFGQGALFQLGQDSTSQTRLDMAAGILSTELGDSVNGYLSSLKSGGANELATNAANAATIAAAAKNQIAIQAGRVGSFSKYQIGSSIRALEAAQAGLASSLSLIEDTDFALDTALADRQAVLLNAAISMLAQSNQSQAVNLLTLLQ
jgi:flagellin